MADCPTCEESFKSEQGMKVHHTQKHGESISGVEVECDNCGDTMRRRESRIEEYENLFCGLDCKDAHHSEQMTGRERPEHAELMSEMHSGEDNPMHGVRGEDAPMFGVKGENHPSWSGGENRENGYYYYEWRSSSEWLEARRAVIDRDDGECQICGDSDDLHVHHIQPVSEGGAKFDVDNLILLCPEHHYERH